MAVLLIAEVNGGALNADATGKALSAVASLGDVTVLCASSGCEGAAEDAASCRVLRRFWMRWLSPK